MQTARFLSNNLSSFIAIKLIVFIVKSLQQFNSVSQMTLLITYIMYLRMHYYLFYTLFHKTEGNEMS